MLTRCGTGTVSGRAGGEKRASACPATSLRLIPPSATCTPGAAVLAVSRRATTGCGACSSPSVAWPWWCSPSGSASSSCATTAAGRAQPDRDRRPRPSPASVTSAAAPATSTAPPRRPPPRRWRRSRHRVHRRRRRPWPPTTAAPTTARQRAPPPTSRSERGKAVATAQALLDAFADGSWNDARTLNPGRNESDAFLQNAYGPIEQATVDPGRGHRRSTVAVRRALRHRRPTRTSRPVSRRCCMCSHWQVDVEAQTIVRLDSARHPGRERFRRPEDAGRASCLGLRHRCPLRLNPEGVYSGTRPS